MLSRKRRIYSFFIGLIILGYSWIVLIFFSGIKSEIIVCPIKTVTGFPCPSCGSTRAVFKILRGEFLEAIYINPLGILLIILAFICPIWLIYDFLTKKETLWIFYNRFESFINQKKIAIPLILLVIANWIWNILKGL